METDYNQNGELVCKWCRNRIYGVLNEEEQHKNCKTAYGEWEGEED